MTSRSLEESQTTQVDLGPNQSQQVNVGHQKPPSQSNRTLILAILIFLILTITFKFVSLQIQTQKDQPQAQERSIKTSIEIELTFANLTNIRHQRQGQIQRIKNSQTTFECIKISPVPHYFRDRQVYFASDYGIFVQGCIMLENYPWSITRSNLKKWNNDRTVTEWALQRLVLNEKVLYYRPEVYNIPEVTLLRSLIGQRGEIVVLESGLIKECLNINLNLHGLNSNIRYESLASLKDISQFTTIIADVSLFTKSDKNLLEQVHPSTKIFIFAKNSFDLMSFGQIKTQQFRLPTEDCGKGYFTKELSYSGFYEIHQHSKKVAATSSIMSFLHSQYSLRKSIQIKNIKKTIEGLEQMQLKCLSLNSERIYQQVYLSIYGRRLVNVSESEVREWQQRRQAVEWLRTKIQEKNNSGDAYYEMNDHFNLVAIVEIALLVNDSTLYVVCKPTQCERIQEQKDLNSINNIQFLAQKSLMLALASDFLISDNEILTEQCIQKGYSSNGQVLVYFSHTRNESLEALRRLYVHHHLRQVTMRQSLDECLGFEYLHYFWNADEPEGFYQLKPSSYVVYIFWGEPARKLKEQKRLLIQQLTTLDVESKVLGPEGFMYFQVPENPIHPAFSLLSFIHKSDYFRMYMMHSYGGGYSDVKHMHFLWRPYLEGLEKDADHLAYGYGEIYRQDVACFDDAQPSCNEIQSQFRRLLGNCLYAFKKNTSLTTDWYNRVTSTLDIKYEEIKKNPPQTLRQFYGGHFLLQNGTNIVSKYPLRWAEIGGEKLARAQYKYLEKVKVTMPYVNNVDYRILQNND